MNLFYKKINNIKQTHEYKNNDKIKVIYNSKFK